MFGEESYSLRVLKGEEPFLVAFSGDILVEVRRKTKEKCRGEREEEES